MLKKLTDNSLIYLVKVSLHYQNFPCMHSSCCYKMVWKAAVQQIEFILIGYR